VTFPVVAATNTSSTGTAGTTHTVSLPASIAAGDLLLIFLHGRDSGGVNTPGFSAPSGWSTRYNTDNLGNAAGAAVFYKVASGSEGASVNVTSTNNVESAHASARVTGYAGTPESGTVATGTSTTPNPPSLTPSWGALDTLWFAVAHPRNSGNDLTAPTNYGSIVQSLEAGSSTQVAFATRNLNATSDDPGTFANANNAFWFAGTIGVQPAAEGQPAVKRMGGVEGAHSLSSKSFGPKVW
jgi:hypothetical protein